MSPLIPTSMNPRLYLSTSSPQKIAKWIPDAHVSFSLVSVNILKSIFLFKHSSQISLALYEHIALWKPWTPSQNTDNTAESSDKKVTNVWLTTIILRLKLITCT